MELESVDFSHTFSGPALVMSMHRMVWSCGDAKWFKWCSNFLKCYNLIYVLREQTTLENQEACDFLLVAEKNTIPCVAGSLAQMGYLHFRGFGIVQAQIPAADACWESGHSVGALPANSWHIISFVGPCCNEVPKKPAKGTKVPKKGEVMTTPVTVHTWGTMSSGLKLCWEKAKFHSNSCEQDSLVRRNRPTPGIFPKEDVRTDFDDYDFHSDLISVLPLHQDFANQVYHWKTFQTECKLNKVRPGIHATPAIGEFMAGQLNNTKNKTKQIPGCEACHLVGPAVRPMLAKTFFMRSIHGWTVTRTLFIHVFHFVYVCFSLCSTTVRISSDTQSSLSSAVSSALSLVFDRRGLTWVGSLFIWVNYLFQNPMAEVCEGWTLRPRLRTNTKWNFIILSVNFTWNKNGGREGRRVPCCDPTANEWEAGRPSAHPRWCVHIHSWRRGDWIHRWIPLSGLTLCFNFWMWVLCVKSCPCSGSMSSRTSGRVGWCTNWVAEEAVQNLRQDAKPKADTKLKLSRNHWNKTEYDIANWKHSIQSTTG